MHMERLHSENVTGNYGFFISILRTLINYQELIITQSLDKKNQKTNKQHI